MKNFQNNVAVITGGASGLGKEFAKTSASLGMKLVLADIQQDALDKTVAEFRAQGTEVIGLRVDIAKERDVQALADLAINTFGKVSLLFNNAGVTAGGLVWENSDKDWEWILGVNLRGVIHGLRIFTPLMLAEAAKDPSYEGHIVNTASMAGLLAGPGMGIYSVSKHAVVALSECLYHDLSLVTEQVCCSVLCPTYVTTDIGQSDKHRPQHLTNEAPLTRSQQAARTLSQDSIQSAGMTAAQVSEVTFEAIAQGSYCIFPDPAALALVSQRFESLVGQQNPRLVFEGIPILNDRRERLSAAIRG